MMHMYEDGMVRHMVLYTNLKDSLKKETSIKRNVGLGRWLSG